MSKSIIIIGAGIAGLSAGCYGQMNKYNTSIFEMHDIPGGLCTSWIRKGYKIDGCIHWLVGSGPKNDFYNIWRELGALQGREFINHEEFLRIKGKDEKELIVYTDVDRLESHMLQIAPEDKEKIKEFTHAIRVFTRFNMPIDKAPELYGILDRFKLIPKLLPFMKLFGKYRKLTLLDFAMGFKNSFLRENLHLMFDMPEFPLLVAIMTLSWLHNKSAGFPKGGSLDFAKAIEERYLELGGRISYKSKVVKILVENNRAVGVRLEDGSEHRADIIISAADGYTTIFNMLESKYIDEKIRNYYEELPIFPPLIQISLGVNRDLKEEPHAIIFPLQEPIEIAGEMRKSLSLSHYCYDPTLSPSGKSILTVILQSNYEYWHDLYRDRELYKKEKEKIAEQVVKELEKRFIGIKEQIEVNDVATPMTYERYTGNWQGTFEGWLITPKSMNTRMSKTLPGLSNLYMVGQWVEPGGGLPPAAFSGRNVIQIICKNDKKKFNALST